MATEAQLRKRRENKARRRNLQRLKKLANNRLSHQEEQQAIYMSKHLHRCLILGLIVGPTYFTMYKHTHVLTKMLVVTGEITGQ
jgi:hypothetical protein